MQEERTIDKEVTLSQITLDGEPYFMIYNVDSMRPFFMSMVSDSNHWMFIGSNGGLTAGRKNAEYSLFPYYTDDKIIESAENTGSKSIFIVRDEESKHTWEPFSIRDASLYSTTRNLYKNIYGNKICFEEINHDLNLTFQYSWNSSDKYGFVKKSKLINNNAQDMTIELIDGIQNIVPYGVGSALQNQQSNLVDAYKRSELEQSSKIGIFALSAIIVDKAEPSEALKANIVWSHGLENPTHLLSSLQLDRFRKGLPLDSEYDIKAEKGAYFITTEISLPSKATKEWMFVANVNKSISSINKLSRSIKNDDNLKLTVDQDIESGTKRLIELNAATDGIQLSNDHLRDTRHFSNALFNIMRGGIFDYNYQIDKNDFLEYLSKANKELFSICSAELEKLPEKVSLSELKETASSSGEMTFNRLCLEYLPLKFSRRHGDPSRPWNKFSINTQDEHGNKILDYEGNWRDIFQNWEALAHSYPEFIEGMIFRFLNASTFDGYNPYRITKNGIDWERIEPDDPWSYIGYWGDHQIIYLLKFLEFAENHYPGQLQSYFDKDLFVYSNVPYRIKPYDQILANPKDTIDFDQKTDQDICDGRSSLGADSALLTDKEGDIIRVNFIEKLLASVLAKMSNFIPEAGIWMNTQRPEWNDANNALVGNGVSMVTLCYLIRFLKFTNKLFHSSHAVSISISKELKLFLNNTNGVLNNHINLLSGTMTDHERKKILDGLGIAGSNYRTGVYNNSFEGKKDELKIAELIDFNNLCLQYLEHTLKANKRSDNLYHAYNLMSIVGSDEVSVSYLSEMLEGQVAVLSSGYLSAQQALDTLDALKGSSLFRADQYSYILYPNKDLPGLLDKNNISEASVKNVSLLQKLVEDGNTQIIQKDINGVFHFNGNFKNASDLKQSLEALGHGKYATMVEADMNKVLQVFEEVFNHKAFTGRSGTFFGYEGLGSIYWHMVSKLQLAVQECCINAINEQESDEIIGRLLEHYYEINEGIGLHKSPALYGAFPTDPYSHTPAGKGAQQPGMTGQVKEDILSRFGELGVMVDEGKLTFRPFMLRKSEFLDVPQTMSYVDVNGQWHHLKIDEGSLCFTYCQIPVTYKLSDQDKLEVILTSGTTYSFEHLSLNPSISQKMFERDGSIKQIIAYVKSDILK